MSPSLYRTNSIFAANSLPLHPAHNDAVLARRCLLLAVLLSVAGVVMLWFDLLVVHALLSSAGPVWTQIRQAIGTFVRPAETFANGLGVLLLFIVLYAADEAHRRALPRAALVVYGAGILANLGKLLIARTRPRIFLREDYALSGTIVDTFQGWLPLVQHGYAGQSFPSGHSATAAALAIVLARRWPHATWAFAALAGMSAVQRLSFGHHYVSDCCWGAALACLVAAAFYHPQCLGRWFQRIEAVEPPVQSEPEQAVDARTARERTVMPRGSKRGGRRTCPPAAQRESAA
jgi:membrane-associated phospholipid phosphatase